MATRNIARRGGNVDIGTKTHQQVFEEHISAGYGVTKNQTKIGNRDARKPNRIKSGSIASRGTSKTGRGYTRQDWISHHRQIVEKSAQSKEDRVGTNKMELLNAEHGLRQNISEHKGEQIDNNLDLVVDTSVESTGTDKEDGISTEINVCISKLQNWPNDKQAPLVKGTVTDTPTQVNRTEELYVLAEVPVPVPDPNDSHKAIHQQFDSTGSDHDTEMDLIEVTDRHTQRKTVPFRNVTDTNQKESAAQTNIDEHEIVSEHKFALLTQAEKEQKVTTFAIKKEALEEATTANDLFSDDTSVSDTSMGSEPDELVWYDRASPDTSRSASDGSEVSLEDMSGDEIPQTTMKDDTSPEEQGMIHDSSQVVVKRKPEDAQYRHKAKRLHRSMIYDHDKAMGANTGGSSQEKSSESDATMDDMDTTSTATLEDNKGNSCTTENKIRAIDVVKPTIKKTTTNDVTNNCSAHKTTIYQTDSDAEWENISRAINKQNEVVPKKRTNAKGVHFNPEVRVETYNNTDDNILLRRGLQMMEVQETKNTPIRIEYNLDNTQGAFNIVQELNLLFTKIVQKDSTVKILNTAKEKILWEANGMNSEDKTVTDDFQVREQTFRNGNRKITLYCVVISTVTINQMKFSDPLKRHLLENNIWIRPDYYSTQVVICPGFFTLIHPKITNKQDFTNRITADLQKTQLPPDDEVLLEWKTNNNITVDGQTTPVPKFHVETSTRKWGRIHIEVLSIHTSKEHAKYLKYLLSAASEQSHITQGLYVPTGIHLLQGRLVLTELLQEHYDFVQQTTSFQISGIHPDEMNTLDTSSKSTKTLLMQCEGVHAVERTYHTEHSRQWLLVISKSKAKDIADYVKNNLSHIYQQRKGQSLQLVNNRRDDGNAGYRLILVENITSTISSYAEILKRRFPRIINGHTGRHGVHTDTKLAQRNAKVPINSDSAEEASTSHHSIGNTPSLDKDFPPLNTQTNANETEGQQMHDHTNFLSTDAQSRRKGINHPANITQAEINNRDREIERKRLQDLEKSIQTKLIQLDDKVTEKMKQLETHNQTIMEDVETRVAERIEDILGNKLSDLSNIVADKVTARMLKAMKGVLNGNRPTSTDCNTKSKEPIIVQTSPHKQMQVTPPNTSTQHTVLNDTTVHSDSTKRMIEAITLIEQETTLNPDSHHDTFPLESKTGVK